MLIEFSLNSVTKTFVIKRARTCDVFVRNQDATSKTDVRDSIFKLNSIHASMIYQTEFAEIAKFNEGSAAFRKNSSGYSSRNGLLTRQPVHYHNHP